MLSCEPIYTGGGIYCFRGQLSDNEWFVADDDFFDVTIVNSDVWEIDENGDDVCWFFDWQEEHLIKYLDDGERLDFIRDMLYWIIENEPKGNYLMSDLERDLDEVKQLIQQNN